MDSLLKRIGLNKNQIKIVDKLMEIIGNRGYNLNLREDGKKVYIEFDGNAPFNKSGNEIWGDDLVIYMKEKKIVNDKTRIEPLNPGSKFYLEENITASFHDIPF